MSSNFDDDDAPPELIDVSEVTGQSASIEEEQTPRVPITLVTGIEECLNQVAMRSELTMHFRILGSGQNYPVELYLDGETWEEDCCDHERFVLGQNYTNLEIILIQSIEFGDCKTLTR